MGGGGLLEALCGTANSGGWYTSRRAAKSDVRVSATEYLRSPALPVCTVFIGAGRVEDCIL